MSWWVIANDSSQTAQEKQTHAAKSKQWAVGLGSILFCFCCCGCGCGWSCDVKSGGTGHTGCGCRLCCCIYARLRTQHLGQGGGSRLIFFRRSSPCNCWWRLVSSNVEKISDALRRRYRPCVRVRATDDGGLWSVPDWWTRYIAIIFHTHRF